MHPLEQSILRTVAYFDMFSYPLTSWEIWKWLFPAVIASPVPAGRSNPVDTAGLPRRGDHPATSGAPHNDDTWSYAEVSAQLAKMPALAKERGFFFLQGHEANVTTRQERYRLALHKFKRARRYAKVLARVPFVRAVAVCNSLGLSNARPESDIDLFIIAKPGHAWTTRFFAAGWAQLRKLRPQRENRSDKVCLSFFITEDVGDLTLVRNTVDPYFTVWLATLVPLYDPYGNFATLWKKNTWLTRLLPQALPRALAQQKVLVQSFFQVFFEVCVSGKWFEGWAERFQQRRLPENLRILANQDTRVVLNQRILKFHDNDRRDEYAQRFQQACNRLGI